MDKSSFCLDSVEVAGHHISNDGICLLQTNVEELLKIESTTTGKDADSFLTTANYYMKFVQHNAEIATPLRVILNTDPVFNWTDEWQHAFDERKRQNVFIRVSAHWNVNCHTLVSTDATGLGLGPVLS